MSDTPQDPSIPEPRETPEAADARLAQERDAQATRPLTTEEPHSYTSNNRDEQWAPAPPAHPARPARTRNIGLVAALAIGALVGGVSGAGVTAWSMTANPGLSSTNSAAIPQTITVNDASNATNVTAVAAKTGPSVVTVSVTGFNAAGTGSGVILSRDGYVVTNTHVVTLDGEASDTKIQVQTSNGHLYTAKLIGTDPITDLAVIKINSDTAFQPVEFADSSKLNVGDVTIAIGAPLGLANTVTNGIVSALDRSITVKSSAAPKNESDAPDDNGNDGNGPFNFWELNPPQSSAPQTAEATISLPVIQTDAAINPGNSGGALLDSEGKLIGINVAIASTSGSSGTDTSGNIGVGFAVPSNLVERIATELKDDGSASHGLLGASVRDVHSDATITSGSTVGAVVAEVTNGGAADKAGIRAGDVVVKFNGSPITGATDLTAQVRSEAAGSTAKVTYVRGGDAKTVTVTLGALT
jgi:putative serine protease PepD